MVAFGWINMFLCLIMVLQLTVTVQNPTPYAARVRVTVSLPCKGLTHYQCGSITWLFSHSGGSITLHEHGKILEAKSGQLSVGSDCSLNIKMVTLEDAGRYTCRQFRSGQQHGEDTVYDISVVNGEETNTSPIKPRAATSTTTTIKSASKGTSISKTAKPKATKSKSGPNTTATNGPPKKQAWRWWLIIVLAVGLTLLIITVVLLIRWRKAKGNKTKTGENMADSVNGVSYASITYTKRNNNKVQVQDKNDDEDDAVTYSTVKTSSSRPADLNDLYATVNKLNK